MNLPNPLPAEQPAVAAPAATKSQGRPFVGFCIAALIITAAFGSELFRLVRFALASDLYSHIPLVPAVTAFLIWQRRKETRGPGQRAAALSLSLAVMAAGLLVARHTISRGTAPLAEETAFAIGVGAYLLLLVASGAWFLGAPLLRRAAFPIGFLVFMIPIPASWMSLVEIVLQHGSAAVAHLLFTISGTALFYDNLSFQLPGISLRVAPECSGIHSSLALLMVSLLAGHLFLRSPWKAALLTIAVFPLALLRNGFRIFVIGELCVHRGPHMIDSPIHRHGGPLFFVLSLIPFVLFLWLLMRSERTGKLTAQG